MSTERGALPMLARASRPSRRWAARANERERATPPPPAPGSRATSPAACGCYGEIVIDHPRDLLALQIAHVGDFYLGQSTLLRDRIARVLPHWSSEVPGYGYVLGMHAFGLEETGDYAPRRGDGPARRSS